jgi:hypothetical protein
VQQFTHFSRHAFERLTQRTRLSCEEIARILDRRLVVNTGKAPGFNRNHLVFYSVPDDDFFVAIQDELTGTVITILPLEYQANLAWEISNEDCAEARKILLSAPEEETPAQTKLTATVFVISGIFLDNEGNSKIKVILKTASAPYQNDFKTLFSDHFLFSKLDELARSKGINAQQIYSILIRLGNHGNPIIVDLCEVSSLNNAVKWKPAAIDTLITLNAAAS